MTAVVQVQLLITSTPEARLKKDGTAYTFATAKEGDDGSRSWELLRSRNARERKSPASGLATLSPSSVTSP